MKMADIHDLIKWKNEILGKSDINIYVNYKWIIEQLTIRCKDVPSDVICALQDLDNEQRKNDV